MRIILTGDADIFELFLHTFLAITFILANQTLLEIFFWLSSLPCFSIETSITNKVCTTETKSSIRCFLFSIEETSTDMAWKVRLFLCVTVILDFFYECSKVSLLIVIFLWLFFSFNTLFSFWEILLLWLNENVLNILEVIL